MLKGDKIQEAIIYCRVSSERQKNEGHGLDSQEHRCREYATSYGYKVSAVFQDSFTGGGDFMLRPAMSGLLRYVDKYPDKKFTVIFDDLKRFARDTEFHLKLRMTFKGKDITPKCLNYNFDDSPEGKYVETILAAGAELEKNQNKRQVVQKMKARLEKGYWTFGPPPGYKAVKSSEHGKLLTRQEPKASILREAFEGYANDRFITQIDVARFLKEKNFNGNKPVYPYFVKRLFARIIYAGYIEYPDWEVSRRKGCHEAIISLETFERVQEKLSGRALVLTRKDFNVVFPLRGFVCCSTCGEPMTASESTGRHGGKHPYYRCRNRTCTERDKSIKKKELEKEFGRVLKNTEPSKNAISLTKVIVEDVYKKRKESMSSGSHEVEKELKSVDEEINKLSERVVKANKESVIEVYENQIDKLSKKKVLLESKSEKMKAGPVDVGTAFCEVMSYLKNPVDIWENGTLNDKRRVLKLVFADKFIYDRETGVGTAKVSVLYEVFEQFRGHKLQDVEMGGIEPPCKKELLVLVQT